MPNPDGKALKLVEPAQPPRRKPGRPKGSPKVPGSGRKPGQPNRSTKELRELIMKRGRPIELLAAVCAGRRVKTGYKTYEYPTMEARLAAARLLLERVIAPARPVADDGDRNLNVEVVKFAHEKWLNELEDGAPDARRMREIETARRVAFTLARGAQNSEPLAAVYPHPGTPKEPEPAAETSTPEPQTEAQRYAAERDAAAAQTIHDRMTTLLTAGLPTKADTRRR